MSKLLQQLRLRPRLLLGTAAGVAAGLLWPLAPTALSRCLVGWDVGVWVYLLLTLHMMLRDDHQRVQSGARARADGMAAMLLLAVAGAAASLGAITLELSQVRQGGGGMEDWPYLLLAVSTVAGSWLLLPVEFALAYASLYHAGNDGPHGLEFPDEELQPDYIDFMYFSVTLAATSQTSDVTINARPMRRLVLLHAVMSFVFNTVVLALTINILAGLLS